MIKGLYLNYMAVKQIRSENIVQSLDQTKHVDERLDHPAYHRLDNTCSKTGSHKFSYNHNAPSHV